jgi:hypothetical protein
MGIAQAIPVLVVVTTPLGAQTSYRLPQRDTLKYQEVTHTRIELHPPTGAVTITTGHDATIAVTTARADTVTAWYEALSLSSAGPQGEWRPSTSGVLRLPFRLVLTPAGRVTTLSAPTFPSDIAAHTDLTVEFVDFFISLPRSELHPSGTWADTLEDSTVKSTQDNFHYRHVRRYRALGDTLLAGGVTAIVIAVEQDITFRTSSPMPDSTATLTTRLAGHEEGTAVFAPRLGRLVARSRRAHLVGVQTLVMKGGQLTAPIAFDYSSSLIGLR